MVRDARVFCSGGPGLGVVGVRGAVVRGVLGVGEDVFLLGYEPITGRHRVPVGVLRAGVIGGVLADLVLAGQLTVNAVGVRVSVQGEEPGDPVRGAVWQQVRYRPGSDVGYWVENLDTVPSLVLSGLLRDGLVRRIRAPRGSDWWRPAHQLRNLGSAYARGRTRQVGRALAGTDPLPGPVLALAGILDGIGLLPLAARRSGNATPVDPGTVARARATIRRTAHQSTHPGLCVIFATVEDLAHRTPPLRSPEPGAP